MKQFIFILITEPNILSFLVYIQRLLNDKTFKSLPHITIRGPYKKTISENTFNKIVDGLTTPIKISTADCFENSGEIVLFLRAHIDQIKEIWWKPSFPVNKFGFNPHITIYKGQNKKLALAIMEYINRENLTINCREYKVVKYTPKGAQLNLFDPASYLSFDFNGHFKKITKDIEEIVKNTQQIN